MARSRITRIVLASLISCAVLGVGVAPIATAEPSNPAPAMDFYTPPNPLAEGAPGTVIRAVPSVDALIPGTPAVLDARVTRLMYRSVNVKDQPVAVTGTLLVPTRRWAGRGPGRWSPCRPAPRAWVTSARPQS